MPLKYKPSKFAYYTVGKSLTEQEHKDSCDINKMIRKAASGLPILGSGKPIKYGFDDLTQDGTSFRILKQKVVQNLEQQLNQNEFTEEEIKIINSKLPKDHKFKIRKKVDKKNDKQNDDKKVNTEITETKSDLKETAVTEKS